MMHMLGNSGTVYFNFLLSFSSNTINFICVPFNIILLI